MKKLVIPEIKCCYECPWLVDTGREEPWCGKNHKEFEYDDELDEYPALEKAVPEWCELEDA